MPALARDKFGFPLTTDFILPSNTKISKDYSFNAQSKKVTVNDIDLRTIVLVVNLAANVVIYNPTSAVTNGTLNGVPNVIILEYDTSRMSDNDDLMILYEYEQEDLSSGLECILTELQKQTKILQKIKD